MSMGMLDLLAWGLLAAPVQEPPEWVEVRFHRVHLRNGNFLDGQMLKDSTQAVQLRVKGGDISVRKDQIDRVEYVKMRSLSEKPPVVKVRKPVEPAPTAAAPAPEGPVDESLRAKVDEALDRLGKAPENRRGIIVREIADLGEDAPFILAGRLEALDEGRRELAAQVLVETKSERARPAVRKLLGSPQPAVRALAARIAGAAGWSQEIAYLRALLQDRDARVRAAAIVAMEAVGDDRTLDTLADAVEDPDREVRAQAIATMDSLARKHERVDELFRMLQSSLGRASSADARADLIGAVAGLGRSEAWRPLAAYMSDSEGQVRAAAVMALASLGVRESAPEILARFPLETDRLARLYLATAAQRFKMGDAVELLVGWLQEDDPELGGAVAVALQAITGENLGNDRGKWLAWWREKAGR